MRGVSGLGEVLYASGLFLTANADYQVLWRKEPSGTGGILNDTPLLERGDLFGVKLKANEYNAISLMPSASEGELQRAGESYPPGIASRYLALPASLPARVRSLAAEITAQAANPYDKASAIEAYLRQIPYNLNIPMPPPGRDVADYFLFDLRQGYCDYYATAMVVMARSVGIPARLVIGYARGGYDPYQAQFIVTAADAHSWVEIYFPGIGWVEFEPTGNQPIIPRPQTTDRRPPTASQARSRRTPAIPDWLSALALRRFTIASLVDGRDDRRNLAGGLLLAQVRRLAAAQAYPGEIPGAHLPAAYPQRAKTGLLALRRDPV